MLVYHFWGSNGIYKGQHSWKYWPTSFPLLFRDFSLV